MENNTYIPLPTEALKNRWISTLRHKAKYEHNARNNEEAVTSPDLDDICNEIEAFFTGLDANK